ncbi:MAG: nucleotidyltransferase domain-containing protein [bacterium]
MFHRECVDDEQQGIQGIIQEITKNYPHITSILLYGSKATGDFAEDSDIDLLFICDTEPSRSSKNQLIDAIYEHELRNDIVISAIFVSKSAFSREASTFVKHAKKEGIVLWLRE